MLHDWAYDAQNRTHALPAALRPEKVTLAFVRRVN
jgi:hypothetical protein